MRNPRNYSIPQEKYRGAHVQKLSPCATNKGEPGKVLTRAPCAKILRFQAISSTPHKSGESESENIVGAHV
jgi:hypothetical protein